MATISISLPDELVHYLDQKIEYKNLLITSILQEWQRQQEDQELAQACSIVDELDLGWTEECQIAAIMDLEVSGLAASMPCPHPSLDTARPPAHHAGNGGPHAR